MSQSQTDIVPGSHAAPAQLGDVLVLGLGKSGRATAEYCLDRLGGRVRSVTVAAGAANDGARAQAQALAARGARVAFDTFSFTGRYDLCVASPGISQFEDFYRNAQAASGEIVSEVEFAWRESAVADRWVGITGTNGKTTTTALTAHLLREAGIEALPVGNIGDTCIDAVAANPADGQAAPKPRVLVAEVSSYQLASTRLFAPQVAVLLNITPDHLAWHKSFEAYAAAKRRIFANLAGMPGGLAILDATDDEARASVRAMKAAGAQRGYAYLPLGAKAGLEADMHEVCGSDNAAFVGADGMLRIRRGDQVDDVVAADELQIKGRHNLANALAACGAALAMGAPLDAVHAGLRSFAPLAHRIEPCGQIAGVACYNDSKATNVDATLKALAAFGDRKPIALLGGFDKGTDLAPLVAAAARHCTAVVCFGAAGPRFEQAFAGSGLRVVPAAGLESALDAALSLAHPGDIVLLSPACASFDEFNGFEARGDAFKRLVAARRAAQGDADGE